MAAEKISFVFAPETCDEQIDNYYKLSLTKYSGLEAKSIVKAKSILNTQPIDLVLSSVQLSDGTGTELHKYIF